jgi:hypothetical protein
MLIAQKTPEKETPKMLPPYERLDAKVMKWASAQFACFGPLMQGYFDITQAQTPFSSVQVPTQGDPSKHWMIVGEIPVEADRSVVYAFNRADGMVHSFNAYGAVRQQGEPEQWELVPDKTESIYDLK